MKKTSIIISLLVVLAVAAYVLFPNETMFWAKAFLSPFAVLPAPIAVVSITLWFAIFFVLDRWENDCFLQWIMIGLAPFFFNIDLILPSIYTVKVEDAAALEVGFWRFILLLVAVCMVYARHVCESRRSELLFDKSKLSVACVFEQWYPSLGITFGVTIMYAAIWLALILISSQGSNTWLFARYCGLTAGYTVASFINGVWPLITIATKEPIAAIIPIAYFSLLTYAICRAVIVARCMGYAAKTKSVIKIGDIVVDGREGNLFTRISRKLGLKPNHSKHKMPKQVAPKVGFTKFKKNSSSGYVVDGRNLDNLGNNSIGNSSANTAGVAGNSADAVECACEMVKLEEPSPLSHFTSTGGKEAREMANNKGLVALYYGRARLSLYDGKHEYVAIPESLAERLLGGSVINANEKAALEKWVQSGEISVTKTADGSFYAKVKSDKLASDIKGQLNSIKVYNGYKRVVSRKPDYAW